MKLKDKFKQLYEDNKGLIMTAIILNITFMIITILSLCGINIAKLSCSNEFLINLNNWLYSHNLHMIVAGLIFASNIYFMTAVCSNDYTLKPLIYTICLLPVFVIVQYITNVPAFVIIYLIPFCITFAYSFKFSTIWKSILFTVIIVIYQYLMQITKLNIFGFEYLTGNLLTFILLSIDLYVVFIFYFCICKTIYKNKLKKEVK